MAQIKRAGLLGQQLAQTMDSHFLLTPNRGRLDLDIGVGHLEILFFRSIFTGMKRILDMIDECLHKQKFSGQSDFLLAGHATISLNLKEFPEIRQAIPDDIRHGFLLIVAERAYLWRLQLLAEVFEAPLRAASGSGALPADAARQCFGVLHELLAVHARLLSKLEVHLAPDADEGSLAGVLLDAARSDWGAYPKQAKLWAHAGEVRAERAARERAPPPPLRPSRASLSHHSALHLRSTLSASSRPTPPSCYCR